MEWQPIKTAPKDGRRVLIFQPGKKIKLGEWQDMSRLWPNSVVGWKCTNGNFHAPTHWMPLPEPPA
jgi:hypothetical protein